MVVLVILLGKVEFRGGRDLGDDGTSKPLGCIKLLFGCFRETADDPPFFVKIQRRGFPVIASVCTW